MRAKSTPMPFPDPCSVENFDDASLYHYPSLASWKRSKYSKIAFAGDSIIKLASSYGYEEYERFVIREEVDGDEIRKNENVEQFKNFEDLITLFPSFGVAWSEFGKKRIHWILVHRLQYDRLMNNINLEIPESRFVFFHKSFLFLPRIYPGIVQERVSGISLWDMIDHDVVHDLSMPFIKSEYEPLVPRISAHLSPLVNSALSIHINWNIENFIFDPSPDKLYYVDLKPSTIFGRRVNEHNLKNILRDFIR
jgi:hypothetical protein